MQYVGCTVARRPVGLPPPHPHSQFCRSAARRIGGRALGSQWLDARPGASSPSTLEIEPPAAGQTGGRVTGDAHAASRILR
jgi:hypothetical protein